MPSKITFHESYGAVSVAQLRAYKKHNVSPSDHDDLVYYFGEDSHDEIAKYVKENAGENGGYFSSYHLNFDTGF